MENRPLSHIRAPDFGHCLAGSLAGMMLADPGTEVIRIDPPGGPCRQDPAFDRLSGGKRTPPLDLKTDRQPIGGSRQLYELAHSTNAQSLQSDTRDATDL